MKVLHEITVPHETVNDEYVTITKIHFKNGDKVKADQTILEFETSKADVTIEAEQEGFIEYYCKEGEDIEIGKSIAKIFDKPPIEKKSEKPDEPVSVDAELGETLFSKSALELIKKNNLDKSVFKGKDFVTAEDIQKILHPDQFLAKPEKQTPKVSHSSSTRFDPKTVDQVKLSSKKKREIEYLSAVQSAGLTSSVNVFVNTETIFDSISNSLEILKDSLLPLVTYETARLLKKYKDLNAFFTGESIAYYHEVHIGVAVDIGEGLKVLTIPDTTKKSIKEIEQSILQLSNKYLDDQLEPEDTSGSTFTITDLSSERASFFSPLINKQQAAILGISNIDEKLERCILTLTFDHRVTEGKKASNFLADLKGRIESFRLYHSETGKKAARQSTQQIKCDKCFKSLSEDQKFGGTGFVKAINHKGEEIYLCSPCFAGY